MWELKPESLEEEIAQNIRFILSTPKGSVPMMRDLGIDHSLLDNPAPAMQAKLKADVVEQVKRFEPRARVKEVTLKKYMEGRLGVDVVWEARNS